MSKGSYNDLFAALRMRESSNNYQAENSLGYIGAYQMGEAALFDAGYYTEKDEAEKNEAEKNYFDNNWQGSWTGKNGAISKQVFLDNSTIQDQAIKDYWAKIWNYITVNDLAKYEGQELSGVEITITGMLGGAHLVGMGALKNYLNSRGKIIPRDGNNVPITHYIELFGNYDSPYSVNHSINEVIDGSMGDDVLYGNDGNDVLNGVTGKDSVYGGFGDDALASYSAKASYENLSQLYGGTGNDHFGVFGHAVIKDIERNDRVYVNNLEVEGGIKPKEFDSPIAWNQLNGHGFAVYGGDINNENGATLAVKYLWDNDAIAFIENYTRPFLGQGDGNIDIYQLIAGRSTPLNLMAKAYQLIFGNPEEVAFDPLALDMDGDGVEVGNAVNQGVYFNMDADSFKERTSWVKADDALLVHDANNNGKVDSISELFGDATQSGFAELRTWDSNNNGRIDGTERNNLKVWRDLDQDGVTDAGELQALTSTNIKHINTTSTPSNQVQNGNVILATGSYETTDGQLRMVADLGFDVRQHNSLYGGTITPSAAANDNNISFQFLTNVA